MAWIGNTESGRWVEKEEREDMIEVYQDLLDVLDKTYPSIVDLDDAGFLHEYESTFVDLERLRRINKCEGNLMEFAIEYFSETRNPGNSGNWDGFHITVAEEAPEFHRELTDIMNTVSTVERNAKVAAAVARSHGKSTWLSKAFPVSEIVYRLRKYIIIISETPMVSKANMEWIRGQFKTNKKLREDFGQLLSPNDKNFTDNSEEFIAWITNEHGEKVQRTKVQAASTGQALRGRSWDGSRPDLIIMDDLEDARSGGNASTPDQRKQLLQWMQQTVIPLGDPAGKQTAYVMMGTTVHRESLLMKVLYDRSDFKTSIYKALIKEPDRMDLWNVCRDIYIDRENPNRAEDAENYYLENKEVMDEGVKVLWEDVQPIWKLMTWRWDNGSLAFNTEYQNNPIDEESMIFNPDKFAYWTDEFPNMKFSHEEYSIAVGVDMAMGKEKGDFSAISVVAKHKENGSIYVIDSFGERLDVSKFLEEVVDMVIKWQPDVVGVESVAAQEFFADSLSKSLVNKGYPAGTRMKKIISRTRKQLRIEAMLPDIENKTIRFSRNHRMLLEQFEGYGQGGGHDDLPDSLEMAISSSHDRQDTVIVAKTMNRW